MQKNRKDKWNKKSNQIEEKGMRNDDRKREQGGYLFWSSWRRQTKKEGWKRQEEELFDEAVYVCLHLLHTFSFSLSFIFSVSIPCVSSFERFAIAAPRVLESFKVCLNRSGIKHRRQVVSN